MQKSLSIWPVFDNRSPSPTHRRLSSWKGRDKEAGKLPIPGQAEAGFVRSHTVSHWRINLPRPSRGGVVEIDEVAGTLLSRFSP